MKKWALALCLGITLSTSANAEWHEASSDHFVVYANQSEKHVRAYTDHLERYHNAMSAWLKVEVAKPTPSNRVTIYVVGSEEALRKIYGKNSRYVLRFYQPRAGSSAAFIPSVDSLSERASGSELVLLHEYAHHMMFANSALVYPSWLREGFAEFYASSKFEKNGDVGLGLPASQRAYELTQGVKVPIERLLDSKVYLEKKGSGYDSFYGQSWLLFHYLSFEESRQGQLKEYLATVNSGTSEIDAARKAFGDLKILDKELNKYLNKRMMNYRKFSGEGLKPGLITVRKLQSGEAAVMPFLIKSKRGVDTEQAAALLPQIRKIAAQYPNDAAVLSALSEAELDAGFNNEPIAAADRATAIDPKRVNAIIQKGYAMAKLAVGAKDTDKAWKDVRKQFVAVNKIENDHPIPLIQYYKSYREQGIEPTANAKEGLQWALSLSPFDSELRYNVAMQHIADKKYSVAIKTLEPLVNSPHESEGTENARKLTETAKAKLAEQQKSKLPAT